MFKKIVCITLALSLTMLTGCITPLTGVQQCALIGEVYQGSAVGSQTHIGSIGHSVYSYNTRVYNPVCRIPQTEAERAEIEKVRPEAKTIKSKNTRNTVLTYVGSLVGGILLAVIIVAGIKK